MVIVGSAGRLARVILTSSNERRDVVNGYDPGSNSYARKPVDLQQFVEIVRQLGRYRLVPDESPPGNRGASR